MMEAAADETPIICEQHIPTNKLVWISDIKKFFDSLDEHLTIESLDEAAVQYFLFNRGTISVLRWNEKTDAFETWYTASNKT